MKLAFELPTTALAAVNPLADLDFVIAYRVLKDAAYAAHYAGRSPGRELILDNGLFELGTAADWPELAEAAELVRPSYIICPDRLNDGRFNLEQLHRAYTDIGLSPERLGLVVTGNSRARVALVEEALRRRVGLLCLPHTEERFKWFLHLQTFLPALFAGPGPLRLHLLGFSSFDELSAWRKLELCLGPKLLLSTDTSKLAKLAKLGRRADDGGRLRGLLPSRHVFDLRLSPRELELCKTNAHIFRAAASER